MTASNQVLVISEHDGERLSTSTAKCVTCAAAIPDGEVTVAVFGVNPQVVGAQAAALRGVNRVLTVRHSANARPLAAVLAPQIAALAGRFSHVLGPSTTFGKDLMPRVAALLDAEQVSDIMVVESGVRFRRPMYAGNVIATCEVEAGAKVVGTVRIASFKAAANGGAAAVESVAVDAKIPEHTRFVSASATRSDRPELQSAAKVVSGGQALGSAESFELLYRLADKLGAAVGASRAAVDAGYASSELQVGQTGKIIAPDLYFAIGISGAIQHMTGIKDARTIVAINKDGEAPIFEVADIGLVGDLFQIVPELERLLG